MRKIHNLFFMLLGSACFLFASCGGLKKEKEIALSKSRLSEIRNNPISYYEKALPLLNSDAPEKGVEKLKEVLSVHKDYPPALQALSAYYIKRKEYNNALIYFSKIKEVNPNLFQDSYELYATALAGDGQFILAQKYLDTFFLKNPNLAELDKSYYDTYRRLSKDISFAIAYGKRLKTFMTVKDLHIQNLGPGVNTKDQEYTPSISLNGKRIIFTRRAERGNEDLYESVKKDSAFEKALPLNDLNTPMNEGSASLSSDGKKLLITYCDIDGGYGKCDIYISYYAASENKWTPPINLGNRINTDHWESQPQFGPNNNSIYFSSDRPGGKGGKDIWISYMDDEGEWNDPINLGGNINTAGDEELPFMHQDNESLYFASNGWQGYGSSDLFLAKRINDRQWESPINLGFPINTIDKEGGLIIEFDAKHGYFSSDKSDGNSQGAMDIYKYEIPEQFRPRPSTWVQGNILNEKNNQAIKAQARITNLRTGKSIGNIRSDRGGSFLITLPVGESYAFNIEKEGYFFYSEHLTTWKDSGNEISKTFYLHPLEVGLSSALKNIFFRTNEAALEPSSFIELNLLVDLMKRNKNMRIVVNGHTDSIGGVKPNLELSKKRALSIKNYLVSQGIAPERIVPKGLGNAQPLASNETEEGRSKNRRSEVVITSL